MTAENTPETPQQNTNTLTPEALREKISKHSRWKLGYPDGERANLRDANLSDADLRDADLRDADLRDADLSDADLRDADLSGADLRDANLSGADLRDANLSGADLSGANLSGANDPLANVPVVENLHAKMLEAIGPDAEKLNMGSWHSTCGTTHCRAGWVVTLAGHSGALLEARYGTPAAAAFIECKSEPRLGWKVPNYYGSNETALDEIKALATPVAKGA